MIIQSANGNGCIAFKSDRFTQENCARLLMKWIKIDFIESIAINTTDSLAEDEYLATISNQLLKKTDKLGSFTVYPSLPLVGLLFYS